MIPDTENRVYGYARRSSDKQILSLETQTERIEEKAAALGWGVDHIFTETESAYEVSWRDRPILKDLCQVIRPGDALIVWQLKRLDRGFYGMFDVAEFFAKRQVHLVVLDFGGMELNLGKATGRAILSLMIMFADMEQEWRTEAVKRGLATLREGELWFHPGGTAHPRYGRRWEMVDVGPERAVRNTGARRRLREAWDFQECHIIKEVYYRRMYMHHSFRDIAHELYMRRAHAPSGNDWAPIRKAHHPKCYERRKKLMDAGIEAKGCMSKKCWTMPNSKRVSKVVTWYTELVKNDEVPMPLRISTGDAMEFEARFRKPSGDAPFAETA